VQISEEEVKQRLDKLGEDLRQNHTSEVPNVTYCVGGYHVHFRLRYSRS